MEHSHCSHVVLSHYWSHEQNGSAFPFLLEVSAGKIFKLFWAKMLVSSKSVLCIFHETKTAEDSLPSSKTFITMFCLWIVLTVHLQNYPHLYDSLNALQKMLSWRPFLGMSVVFPSLDLSISLRDLVHPLCRWCLSCLCWPRCGTYWEESVRNCFCSQTSP